jgi:hypothetical protein
MKKLFCYLFGHSPKKSLPGNATEAHCTVCGEHFIYDEDLDHYFTDKELSTKIEEERGPKERGVLDKQ